MSKERVPEDDKSWYAVDFDGTIAYYNPGQFPELGEPIYGDAFFQVQDWLAEGLTVKILTARADSEDQITQIKQWCKKYLGYELEVTDRKDLNMIVLLDDRARRVETNTGKFIL